MSMTALEELKQLHGHMAENMQVRVGPDENRNWLLITYETNREIIAPGRTNVLGAISENFSKAKSVYSANEK